MYACVSVRGSGEREERGSPVRCAVSARPKDSLEGFDDDSSAAETLLPKAPGGACFQTSRRLGS